MKLISLRLVLLAGLLGARLFAQSYSYHGSPTQAPVPDPSAPLDEPLGGFTAAGNPVPKRGVDDFPAEGRDVFEFMDQRHGPDGKLTPLKLDHDQIRGRNTWILWCAGNETFWSWLQQEGYGFADFLKLIDSRNRADRFKKTGLINQPGMAARAGAGPWGLRIDGVVTPLPNTGGGLNYKGEAQPVYDDGSGRTLTSDGVDPRVYGYPSGVVGIRLFPNPDFTPAEQKKWNADRYYNDPSYFLDPKLVRPLRVGMSCGVCHVGPHPLNPAADPENPKWENLSSNIGSQYLKTQEVFGNLLTSDNLIYHYLRSQQPGTIDTSLTATDNINNANTMNAVFDIPARLKRALANTPEHQSAANLRVPSIEDGSATVNPRHTPRVLLDGSDSIGAFGALARVYLNIGTFYEEWNRVQNPIIGFRPQKPFKLATIQSNSVYWQVNEKYRTGYLAAYFTHPLSTAPLKLADVARGDLEPHRTAAKAALASAPADAVTTGREVFLNNCAICHSSKQPDGFDLAFSDTPSGGGSGWETSKSPDPGRPLTLPTDYLQWDNFKRSPAYQAYVKQIVALAGSAPAAGQEDAFLKDNFLANEVRIPLTLVGTNSGRAVATNGLRGHVWDNFTSEDYKRLPAVGSVRTYNPYRGDRTEADKFGNNDHYNPPGEGLGYYRPATLISLWATGPYLHNNALGKFTGDISIAGRLDIFEDGIRKLLWNSKREATPSGVLHADGQPEAWRRADAAGWVYRTTETTDLKFPGKFLRQLVGSVLGPRVLVAVEIAIFGLALLLLVAGFITGRVLPAHLPGLVLIVIGAVVAYVFYGMGFGAITSFPAWLVPAGLFAIGGGLILWLRSVKIARIIHFVSAAVVLVGVIGLHAFLDGRFGDLRVGPFPRGTPISLLLNLNPETPSNLRIDALAATFKGMRAADKHRDDPVKALAEFERLAGPALVRASKAPDYVLDRGHWFGEALTDPEKEALIAFLRTL